MRKTAPTDCAKRAVTQQPLRLEWIEAGQLAENPKNWRKHPAGQMSALKSIISDPSVGWAGACLYNERTHRLIDGHARKNAVSQDTIVPVLIGSWSEEAEKKILLTLDPLAGMAEADTVLLKSLIDDVQLEGLDLAPLADDLDELLGEFTLDGKHAGTDATSVEDELDNLPHLQDDEAETVTDTERITRDARRFADAVTSIGALPEPNQAMHMVISGRFALWDIIPAAMQLAGQDLARLHVATLGFSRQNVLDLCAAMDAGKIRAVTLLCSHYFRGTSGGIFELAEAELRRRPAAKFLSARTHAKLLAMQFLDGRTLVVESSANLRSCKNIEQMTLIGSPEVYKFHVGWIDGLFAVGANLKDR